jgi:hypothetical protein
MISALVAQPMALVMAFIAAVLVIVAVTNPTSRLRERGLMIAVAIVSGVTAWMMITGWVWPGGWPRLLR